MKKIIEYIVMKLKERSHLSVSNVTAADVSFTTLQQELCLPHSECNAELSLVASRIWPPLLHRYNLSIREIPDHATFRGKGVKTGLVRQTWGMSLFGPM